MTYLEVLPRSFKGFEGLFEGPWSKFLSGLVSQSISESFIAVRLIFS